MLTDLPPRLTTTEVCDLARISRRTLARRMKNRTLDLKPVDRGRERLFRACDVIRAFGLNEPATTEASPKVAEWGADAEAIRAARLRQRARPGRAI